ncbi:NAC domain-containing protein 104-like protein [Gossypium australe]|uniref:NAC domain-containing protein 104-like protein n=1 Tax=Gossypium australe TaxID=47621 RepID=A0A5B6X2Q0_9ROSI|nr:NAC domain-containing protein 104-like protein [Gossypium australe]
MQKHSIIRYVPSWGSFGEHPIPLMLRAALLPCHPDVIPDLHLYPYDPWELDGKALGEGKQWYYYSRRSENRNTRNGYWKAMGMEESIVNSSSSRRAGIKKYLVFFIGDAEGGGVKTDWVMHEYRLSDSDSGSGTSRSSKRRGHNSKIVSILLYTILHL